MLNNEIIQQIAFSSYKGITLSTATELLRRVGTIDNYFAASEAQLASLTGVTDGSMTEQYRRTLLDEARTEADFVANSHIATHFFVDDNYPHRLRDCDDAPTMLYTLGNCDLDSRHVIAMVGTRHATPYGVDFVNRLVKDLAERIDDLVIVSGLAYGIDIAAHNAALREGVPTVAVLAHGLNRIYPADHRSAAKRIINEGGKLVTEYKSCSPMHKGNFLARNRIIAGLSDAVLVAESDSHGGAMSTARIAEAYNREVMAVPGRVSDPYSRGCNDLIARRSASIIRDADDLMSVLGWTGRPKAGTQKQMFAEVTDGEKRIIDYITANPEATVNELCVGLSMPFAQLSSQLFEMEMKDLIIVLPGGKYGVIAV